MPSRAPESPRPSGSLRPHEALQDAQFAAHIGFIFTGFVNTLLGPILPIVSRAWSLNDAQAGRLFAAQFLGAILGTMASSRLMAALGIRRCAMLGLLLMSLGVTATGLSDARFGALAVVCFGLGLGLVVPAINLWIALADPARSAAALTLLNAWWCLGAASCAPLIIFVAEHIGLAKTLGSLGVLLALTAIAGLIASMRRAANVAPAADAGPSSVAADAAALAQSTQPIAPAPVGPLPRLQPSAQRAFIFLICTFMFFYVGTESGVGGWAATYAQRLNLLSAARIGFAQSIFYGALLLGRAFAPFFLHRLSAVRLLLAGLLLAAAGALLFTITARPPLVLAGICIAGIGLAPIFPVTVSIYSDELSSTATRSASLVFTIANVGGALFPWLIGRVSTSMNGLRYGMLVPLACIAAMLVLQSRLSATLRTGAEQREG